MADAPQTAQMVKVRYGPVILQGPEATPAPGPGFWSRLSTGLVALRSFAVSVLVLVPLVALVGFTALELRRDSTVIEAFSVPEPLRKQGLTGEVAAHRLWDAFTEIHAESRTRRTMRDITSSSRQLDLVEPGSGLSLQGLTGMLRRAFGLPQSRIGGEIVCAMPDCATSGQSLRLRLFLGGEARTFDTGPLGERGWDRAFKDAALDVMAEIDPYVVAALYADRSETEDEALRIAGWLLAKNEGVEGAWAANLMGSIHRSRRNYAQAEAMFARALEISPEFSLALNGWGNALLEQREPLAAAEKYAQATRADPDYHAPWNGWGNALVVLQDWDGAIDKYGEAHRLDPQNPLMLRNWAVALRGKGDVQAALAKFEEALALDATDVGVLNGMANTLGVLGDLDRAEAAYRQALAQRPDDDAEAWNGLALVVSERRAEPPVCDAALARETAFMQEAGSRVPPWFVRDFDALLVSCGASE